MEESSAGFVDQSIQRDAVNDTVWLLVAVDVVVLVAFHAHATVAGVALVLLVALIAGAFVGLLREDNG